jgi:hypothetical protein
MQFRARLNQISHIHRTWRGSGAPTGMLSGVVFRWTPGNLYLSDVLSADEVAALQAQPHVTLEATGAATPQPFRDPFSEPDEPEPVRLAPAAFRRKSRA